jgi:ATP-dependent Clp protease ATP-binding subunit ClpA
MARVIQEHIKKPLADVVLFGGLKAGGHVRVVVAKDEEGQDKLSFEYPEGPITPKQEKLPEPRKNRVKRRSSPRKPRAAGPKGDGKPPAGRGSVPKVPLKV